MIFVFGFHTQPQKNIPGGASTGPLVVLSCPVTRRPQRREHHDRFAGQRRGGGAGFRDSKRYRMFAERLTLSDFACAAPNFITKPECPRQATYLDSSEPENNLLPKTEFPNCRGLQLDSEVTIPQRAELLDSRVVPFSILGVQGSLMK